MDVSQGCRRFRWHGLLLAWCFSLVGWGVVAVQPDTFEATTLFSVSTSTSMETVRNKLAADGQHVTVLDMARQSLWDRRQLDEVVQAAGLSRSAVTGNEREKLVEDLLTRIEITKSARWDNLFRITFADTDRRKSLAVVSAIVSVIAEDTNRETGVDQANAPGHQVSQTAANFRIVDPPAVGSVPVAPKRSMWTTLVLVISLGVGACLAYGLSVRKPVFDGYMKLPAIDGIPVVGVVTHAWMARAKARQRRDFRVFGFGMGALLLCYTVVLIVQSSAIIFSTN